MINEIQRFISEVAEGRHLSRAEAGRAFQIIMSGGSTPAQISALLMALRMKGETVGEIIGAATAMRIKMDTLVLPGDEKVIDVCGTGGDGSGMLNVSTAVAIVVAASGVRVAKHGNKSVSSRSGSADVLSALGLNLQAEKSLVEKALRDIGLGFLYAPLYHKALRHVGEVRQELGMRTIFNLLGPLCNPAKPALQLMGVYDAALLYPMAQVLDQLGSERAWVVHGSDGSDELTLTGSSSVAELKDGTITLFEVTPEEAGLKRCDPEALRGGSPEHNARELSLLLAGKASAYRDMVLLNASAALAIAGKAATLAEGVMLATKALESGRAKETLASLVNITNEKFHA